MPFALSFYYRACRQQRGSHAMRAAVDVDGNRVRSFRRCYGMMPRESRARVMRKYGAQAELEMSATLPCSAEVSG